MNNNPATAIPAAALIKTIIVHPVSFLSPAFQPGVNLSKILGKCILQYEVIAFEAGIDISADIDENITITGDATQLRQLFMILIDNALKYSAADLEKQNNIQIFLTHSRSHIYFRIHNSSTVIPTEKLPLLFDRFYQVDESRTDSAVNGYGLGLAIAKSIVEKHKGSISAKSTATNGTTFEAIF